MRLGKDFRFVRAEDLPSLTQERVQDAVNKLEAREGIYAALLVLASARAGDVGILLEATGAPTAEERWRRVWHVGPTLTRLSRSPVARALLVAELQNDLLACAFLAQQEQTRHRSLRKLFARIAVDLLPALAAAAERTPAVAEHVEKLAALITALTSRGGGRLDTAGLRKKLEETPR